jgi:hypothetical protein
MSFAVPFLIWMIVSVCNDLLEVSDRPQ